MQRPRSAAFFCSLNIDLHKESTAQTRERAVAGVTHGLIGLNETVTWRGRHFGLMLTQETRISKYDRPHHFQDVMLRGMSRVSSMTTFELLPDGNTRMCDELRFSAPLGPLGWLAERLFLRRYLANFLIKRNAHIQRVAESSIDVWSRYTAE